MIRKHFSLFIIFTLTFYLSKAQNQIEFGLGMSLESFTLTSDNVFINDSIIFSNYESFKNPLNGTVRGDPRNVIYVGYTFLQRGKVRLNTSLYFGQKWLQISLLRLSDYPQSFPTNYVVPIRKSSLFLPIQFEFKPFENSSFLESLVIRGGLGPTFHFGNISDRIDGYVLNLKNSRKDLLYYETYYQFQDKAHKKMTLDYTWSIQTQLFRRFGLQVNSSGSIGSVTKPFKVFGKEYDVPIHRRGLAFILTYRLLK